MRALDASGRPATISLDVANFLVGEEADRAALEASAIEEGLQDGEVAAIDELYLP